MDKPDPTNSTQSKAEELENCNTREETFLDDVLDISEDDIDVSSDKGSETDSGSYWSAIDEDEHAALLDSQEVSTATLRTEETTVLTEYDAITPVEASALTIADDDTTLGINGKHAKKVERGKNGRMSEKHSSNLKAVGENSNFGNFHDRIAAKLERQTSSPEFRPKKVRTADQIDSENRDAKERKLEKCIEAYDIIDQFDVKISERNEYVSGQLFGVNRIQSLAAGIRRTLSFQRDKKPDYSANLRSGSRDTKLCYSKSLTNSRVKTSHDRSGTWPVTRAFNHDFVDISYSMRKEKNGETVEVLVVSPKQVRKREGGGCLDETDSSQDKNIDIGNADDLGHDSCVPKINDDIDLISLSGFDQNDRAALGIATAESAKGVKAGGDADSQDDAFDDKMPKRPPRKKKLHTTNSLPVSRVSSESDVDREATGPDPAIVKKRHTYNSRPDHSNISKSKSEENIFKGMLPFFESDSKKMSLSAPGGKNIPPNKEELHLFTNAFPPQIVEFPQDRRSLIALEVYTTERNFVKGLEILTHLFKNKALQLSQLDSKEAEIIFSNVHEILDLNKGILDELYKRVSNWGDDSLIGDIFVDNASKFKMYATYCKNYDASEAFVKQKTKKKKDFEAFLQSCYQNPSCQLGLTLPSYLITPVQRTPRYILLLKDLLRKTPPTHPDYNNLKDGLGEMEKIASYINEQLKHSQSEKALAALQQQIIGLKAYYFSGRSLVHEGTVCLMNIKRTYECVLFNDLLVFAVKGDSKQSEVELVLDLSVVWFQDLLDLDPQTTKQDAIGLYTPDRPYTIYVRTLGEKKIWLQHMKTAINKHVLGPDADADTDLDKRSSNHTYKNGCVYSGEFIESKRHGEGTMMWPNQMTYRGQWVDDERNGYGVLEYGNGDVYEGNWKNDRPFGNGVCKYSTGDRITCEWKIGIRHGKATIEFANGDLFEGSFKNDRIEGEGQLTCKNGSHYSGNWKRNMKNGNGVLRMQNGDVYRGEFKCDLFHGHGGIIYSNGAVYNGEFEEGQRHGAGTYTKPNGIIYEGSWMHDCKEGHGKITYANGDVYEGTFMQDKRSGKGRIIYHEGGEYEGQWESDTISGRGVMKYKDGSVYDGKWKYGQKYGEGKMTCNENVTYDGCWHADLYHGKGVLTKPGDWKYKGDFVNGKRHGTGTLTDPLNEYKFQGEWKNDKKEGKGIEMTRGNLYDGSFKNNKRDGRGVETSHDTTTYEGFWRMGQKHGKGVRKLLNGMAQPQVSTTDVNAKKRRLDKKSEAVLKMPVNSLVSSILQTAAHHAVQTFTQTSMLKAVAKSLVKAAVHNALASRPRFVKAFKEHAKKAKKSKKKRNHNEVRSKVDLDGSCQGNKGVIETTIGRSYGTARVEKISYGQS